MIGNNSCGTHSLLAGKTVDNIHELDILLYDGTRMTVGKSSDDELNAIIQQGGRRGEIYARLRSIRDDYAELIRGRFPDIPRRVSGYNLDQLLPEHGFNVAGALSDRGHLRGGAGGEGEAHSEPQHRSLIRLGYQDTFTAADHVMEIEFSPISEG
jgi:hypothetical protein